MAGPLLAFLQQFRAQKRKAFAILIDPDKCSVGEAHDIARAAREHEVDFFLVGGSLVMTDSWKELVRVLKEESGLPVFCFPAVFSRSIRKRMEFSFCP